MDQFDQLIGPLLSVEGGYTNNPADAGGETNWGITRTVAIANGYTGPMRDMTREQASAIYRARYWDAPGFAMISVWSARIAGKLFDIGVNMGVVVAGTFLQRTLNVLNQGGKDYADIQADGRIGSATLVALKAFLAKRGSLGEKVLYTTINSLQNARYVELAEGRAANEAFEFGWIANRITMS